MKKYARITIFTVAATLLLTNASCIHAADQSEAAAVPESTTITATAATQLPTRTAPAVAATITFNGSSASIDGTGAALSGNTVTITQSGAYVLSGVWQDGQVCVDAKDCTVWLILDGVTLTSTTSAPIYNKKSGDFVIKLADGTQNSITDAQAYVYPDSTTDEPDAAIFSKNDIEITGGGALSVKANFNNGIGTKDDLIISGGSFNIESANHGIRGRDSVTITDGNFVIKSGSDGLQSNNDESTDKGWIDLRGGSFDITAANDGIQAESTLNISGGSYRITSGGGSSADLSALSAEESYKGLKAKAALTISGGEFSLDCADDAIHSNTDVTIYNGSFQIATGDDGIHADENLTVHDGTLNISKSYEGLEGATITIAGGVIDVVASDDAINSAGGTGNGMNGGKGGRPQMTLNGEEFTPLEGMMPPTDGTMPQAPPDWAQDGTMPQAPPDWAQDGTMPNRNGQMPQGNPPDAATTDNMPAADGTANTFGADRFASSGDYWLKITGGKLNLTAEFDGLDANGDIEMSGGEVYISTRGGGGDGALDYDGTFTLTGGTLVGVGLSGMTPAAATGSTQPSIVLYCTQSQKAGTKIGLTDAQGNLLATYAPTKDFTAIVLSHPSLSAGSRYTITMDGDALTTLTLGTESTTAISDTGEAVTANQRGMGGMGGGRGGNRQWPNDAQAQQQQPQPQ